jgi:bacillithiol system protein YtxJ
MSAIARPLPPLAGKIFHRKVIPTDNLFYYVALYCLMNWITLQTETQLEEIRQRSTLRPQLIFKHSTRCSTSALVKGRLERAQQPNTIDFYFLDLLSNRPVSNKIAEAFRVEHESPQVLLIRNGSCVYEESHLGITMDEIIDAAA